ncbi:aminopeptidase [Marinobacter sp. GN3S48]|uniref:aminopeptidase n=1 Tax=Marinobacter sp. GN3S48 TaxID=3382302 RepID=UPI00387B5E12
MIQLNQIYLLLLLVAVLPGCSTIGYYSQAIGGHVSLMLASQPVDNLLTNPGTDDELKRKLAIARDARHFADNRLALPAADAFTEYSELERPWVVVNLVAVPEFSLTPHQWCYPVVGCQAYRGYFSLGDAQEEQRQFDRQGFDTFIGAVTAYSTLGWFDDPLHSGFTHLSDDRMVALIFHELAHQVVYIDEDTAFNESFATAVELEGLRLWLEERGEGDQFATALQRLSQRNQTLTLVEHASSELEALYGREGELSVETMRTRKKQVFAELIKRYNEMASQWDQPGPFGSAIETLNNANIALFRQYNQYVPGFRQLLKEQDYRFDDFFDRVRALSELDQEQRTLTLSALSQRFDEHL